MATRKNNVAADFMKSIVAVLFMVSVSILASCGKEPVDNYADNGVLAVRASENKPVNGEWYEFNSYAIDGGAEVDGEWTKTTNGVPTDSAKASATIRAAVELEKSEIEINSTLKNNNVWSFDSISQPVAVGDGYRWLGYMTKNDGQKAVFSFSSKTAALRDSIIGLEPVAIKSVGTTNTATTARSGEKERMTTVEDFLATVREVGTGRSNTVDIPLSATYMRYIPENAPEIEDSTIVWTINDEVVSGHWALANSDKAQVMIQYILSDGSRLDGAKYTIEAPRTIWGMEDKKYVPEFVQTLTSNFIGQQTTEAEKKNDELSNENWDVYYKTITGSWEHNQTAIDGSKAVTAMSVRQPRFVFHHGALRHDFGYISFVATPSVEMLNMEKAVENGNNYDVKQIKNSFNVKYGVDSTGVQNLSAVSTVDLLKQIIEIVPTSWELLSKTNEFENWNHIVGAKYRVYYSDGTSKDFIFSKTINGYAESSPVVTDEDKVNEELGALSDYIVRKDEKQEENLSFAMWKTQVDEKTARSRGEHQYGYSYTIGREVKYVKDFGNGVVVEINFEDPTISHDTEMTDFVKTGEEEVENGTKETWRRTNNLLVNINGNNNTINNYGVINIFKVNVTPDYPEVLKGVINGNIVAPDQNNANNNWYVTYLLDFGTYVRPIAIDKNGNFVKVNGQPFGEKFNKDNRWNGAAIINGQLVPVKGDDLGWGARYTHSSSLSLVKNYMDLSNGFNWDHSTIKNVTKHFVPTVKEENGMIVVTFSGVGSLTFTK
jgi:hypothetical protein